MINVTKEVTYCQEKPPLKLPRDDEPAGDRGPSEFKGLRDLSDGGELLILIGRKEG